MVCCGKILFLHLFVDCCGFNDAQRKEIWETRYEWVGKIVKYKHFAVGAVEAPRFPIFISGAEFVGERHKDDL